MWHSGPVQEADKYPETTGGDATRDPRDIPWVLGVGLAPVLALILTMPVVALLDRQDGGMSDAFGDWNLYTVFGLTVFAPIMVVACVGALVTIANYTAGRWISSAGNVAAIMCAAVLVSAEITDLVTPSTDRDVASWVSALTPSGTAVVVVPYLALLVANVYVLVRLWRPRL